MENTEAIMEKSSVEKILERTQYVERIGEVDYRLRRLSAMMMFRISGTKSFGLVRGAVLAEKKGGKGVGDEKFFKMAKEYLAESMISPRLARDGERTSVEDNVVEFEDLGDHVVPLFASVLKSGGADLDLADFLKSSDEATEATLPEDSTNSGQHTDGSPTS